MVSMQPELFALVDTLHESKYASHDIGLESRKANPGFGWCLRCGKAWPEMKRHTIKYADGNGMFPTCEHCWKVSTFHERIEYCRALFRSWLCGWLGAAWSANVKNFNKNSEWLQILEALVLESEEEAYAAVREEEEKMEISESKIKTQIRVNRNYFGRRKCQT